LALFGFINSAQQVYVEIYGLGLWFPLLFALVAGMMAISAFLNSRFVGRYGMRKLSHGALLAFICAGSIWFVWSLFGELPLPVFLLLFGTEMFLFSWIGSNFNALAMEPLGHIAGSASSVQGFLQTLGGGIIGVTIGQAFDGTTTPLAIGFCGVGLVSLALVLFAEKGRLFQPHNLPSPPSA
jgi:DHA1 family bicyclomycin/chloramphenicol resistance-like MFS transporter